MEFTEEEMNSLMSTTEVAKLLGLKPGQVRRLVAKELIPYRKVLGQFAFIQSELVGWEMPAAVSRRGGGAKKTKEDGTPLYRWTIWATKAEIEALQEAGYPVSNPRAAAAERRARREAKAKEAAGEDTAEGDPFAGME